MDEFARAHCLHSSSELIEHRFIVFDPVSLDVGDYNPEFECRDWMLKFDSLIDGDKDFKSSLNLLDQLIISNAAPTEFRNR